MHVSCGSRSIFRPVRDPIARCLPQEISPCSANATSTTTGETKRDIERYANERATGRVRELAWDTKNATDVSIDSLGAVAPAGTRSVVPSESITYMLTAKGPGGTTQEIARVTVTIPPPPPVAAAGPSDQELFQRNMKDIYFNYDRYDVRAEDAAALKADADFLTGHPSYKILISGHCDERGSGTTIWHSDQIVRWSSRPACKARNRQ